MKISKLLGLACALAFVSSLQAQQLSVDSSGAFGTSKGQIFQVGGTTPLGAAGFSAAVYGSLSSTDPTTFTIIPGTTITTFTQGYIFGGPTITVPGAVGGSTLNYQVRAWQNSSGASWETATVRGNSAGIVTVSLSNPNATPTPTLAPDLSGFTSFALAAVPEPTTIALGILGAGALLLRRRK